MCPKRRFRVRAASEKPPPETKNRASGLYTGSFARRIGLPDSEALYDVLTGLAPLSPELARRIHVCYPQIDLEWLMTGRIRGIELPAAGQSDV
ncbi:hypothetical protein [Alistipes senegalensis]|uniref:hypothetical protein n=1 Tax=Alistipes senegalensis TaxID=1288121 RepID=UPI001F5C7E63|nr:hypothetical protein [Alistipes senegalensis]